MGFELTPKQIDRLFEKASVALQEYECVETMAVKGLKCSTVLEKYTAALGVYLEILNLFDLMDSFVRYLEKDNIISDEE